MSKGPEHKNPDEPVPNSGHTSRSYEAYCSLDELFRKTGMDAGQRWDADNRMYIVLGRYRMLSYFAELEGLRDEERSLAVRKGLEQEKLLSIDDPEKTDEEFKIISVGYELNKRLWDTRLDNIEKWKK
jgi:hypothetical protein